LFGFYTPLAASFCSALKWAGQGVISKKL